MFTVMSITIDNIEDNILPNCLDGVRSLLDDRAVYLMNRFKPCHKTLSMYHGMGCWMYIHKTPGDNLFKVYIGGDQGMNISYCYDEVIAPYNFYSVKVPEYDDCVFIGMNPQDISNDKHVCHGWKQYRLNLVDDYVEMPVSQDTL